jgi:hypothetical protein
MLVTDKLIMLFPSVPVFRAFQDLGSAVRLKRKPKR